MLIKEFLENVCNEIKYKPIREDISEELSLHVQEQKEEYIKYGLEENIAEERAVSNMGEATEIGKKLNKIHRPKFDWILTLLVAILIGFGFLITIIKTQTDVNSGNFYFIRYSIILVIGIIISILIYFFDYRKVLKYYKLLYVISSATIIYTLLFGKVLLGRKYIYMGIINFNPANMCMLIYIISFVGFINNLSQKCINLNIQNVNLKFRIDVVSLVALSAFSIFLLMSLNYVSLALILLFTYIIISTMYIIKLPNRKLNLIKFYGALSVLILIAFCLLMQNGFESRIQRIYTQDESGYGWVNKLIGTVLENSNMFSGVKNEDVFLEFFDAGTDFPLITIIAYCGTIYSAIIIATVIILGVKIIIDCRNIKDDSGKLLMAGFGTFILLQAIFNILMSFNLIPIIGLDLPFVSYGLNSLVINMMMVAFILSIYRRKDILTKEINSDKKLKIKVSFE